MTRDQMKRLNRITLNSVVFIFVNHGDRMRASLDWHSGFNISGEKGLFKLLNVETRKYFRLELYANTRDRVSI